MNKTWDYESGSYSTRVFNEIKEDLEKILKCKLINVEGTDVDRKNCIDAWLVDEFNNKAGIAFRAQRKPDYKTEPYKTFAIRYKKSFSETAKTEYDKLMNPSIELKPYYHIQANDAGNFYAVGISLTNDIIDYMTINELNIITHKDGGKFVVIPWHDLKVQNYYIKVYRIPKK